MASVSIAFDDGSRAVTQTLSLGEDEGGGGRDQGFSVADFYEVERVATFIGEGGFQRVAFQFADHLLRDSPKVIWSVQKALRRSRLESAAAAPSAAENGEGSGMGEEPLLFVTGDTSYGTCCVDEVAAQHLSADAIVHFGRACLSPTSSGVPVLYVFGKAVLDVLDCAARLKEGPLAENRRALLLFDVRYAYCIPQVLEALGDDDTRSRVVVGRAAAYESGAIAQSSANCEEAAHSCRCTGGCACGGSSGSTTSPSRGCCSSSAKCHVGQQEPSKDREAAANTVAGALDASCANECCCQGCDGSGKASIKATSPCSKEGKHVGAAPESNKTLPPQSGELRIGGLAVALTEDGLRDCQVVYLGGEGRQLSNILLRCNSACAGAWSYNPIRLPSSARLLDESKTANRHLRRRFYLVQRAREAGVIGLVAGTLSVRGHAETLRRLRKAIESCGRKAYSLAVGKPSVAKLANFAGVEVFCLVACPENSLLDCRDFHAPVVTPFELEIALGLRDWDGSYSTALGDLRMMSSDALEARKPRQSSKEFSGHATRQNTYAPAKFASSATLGSQDCDGFNSMTNGAEGTGGVGSLRATERSAGGGEADLFAISVAPEPPNSEEAHLDDDGDAPFFSLVSGTYRTAPLPLLPGAGRIRSGGGESGSGSGGGESGSGSGGGGSGDMLAAAGSSSSGGVLSRFVSPAAEFLKSQEYQGLERKAGETEAAAAVEGARGIASDYGGM